MNIQPTQIKGISFFNQRSSCIESYEKNSWIQKAVNWIKCFGATFAFTFYKLSLAFKKVETQMTCWSDPKSLSKKRLVVCIHGLNDNPSQFKTFVDELQKKNPQDIDLFIPSVLEKGNAKLDEMVKPIFEEIKKWANSSQGKEELVLVGISNGGRIARAIETEISKSESPLNIKKLRFISIVGACKGSALVNLANRVGLSRVMSKNISKEMPENSPRNIKLNQEWEEGVEKGPEREYTFIASPHDFLVPNYSSSLMEVGQQKARYAIVPGHGHWSIVNAAEKAVAEIIHSSPPL